MLRVYIEVQNPGPTRIEVQRTAGSIAHEHSATRDYLALDRSSPQWVADLLQCLDLLEFEFQLLTTKRV
jgi:hypothetical protein